MITFAVCILVLLGGYYLYSRVCERIFGIDPSRTTPALRLTDGVDFVPLPWWKVFLIQFLNIAGLGPIFGAIAGALYGPVAFVWIVLGTLFAGGVHDYFSGMLSLRHDGKNIGEITGHYLGNTLKQLMRGFTLVLMVLVGTVFIIGPAKILADVSPEFFSMEFWIVAIFIYYIASTVLPIDKLIGRVYPLFGIALLFMALAIAAVLFTGAYAIPELTWENIQNQHDDPLTFPVFPMVFVTIACGAVSGFHATQSPLMARCIVREHQGRRIFFGAMVTEGIVALIWAAIAMSFFGGVKQLNSEMTLHGNNAAYMVNVISLSTLGKVGGVLAILGVVAAPLTSGDTAFRSARLIIADFFNIRQAPAKNRILISTPLFLTGYLLSQVDFGVVWRYFALTNQILASIVLWTITAFLIRSRKPVWMALVPAAFMTSVVISYLLVSPEGFRLPLALSSSVGIVASAILVIYTLFVAHQFSRSEWVTDPDFGKDPGK